MQDVQSVAAGKGKPSKGVLGWLKENVAGPVLDPFGFRDITKTIGIPQQYIESGLAYATESIINAPANILEVTGIAKGQQPIERTSAKEVWRRANDPDWGVFKDPKYQTGIKPLDTALQLTTDIGTDPFTFMGVGSAKYAGRAGREALALRFATPDMVAKYGDELAQAGVGFDEIVRYGEWALPKTIRETEGINSGLRFAGRTIKGTQGIGADVGMNLAKVRASVGDVVYKASPDLMSKIAPQSQKVGQALGVGRSAAVRGFDLSNKQVATALVGSTAQRHAKGTTLTFYKTSADRIKDTVKTVKAMGWDDFYDLAEDPIRRGAADLTDEQKGLLDNWLSWQNDLRSQVNDVYRKFGDQFGVDVNEIGFVEDYIHHKLSVEGRNWIFSKA